MSTSPVTEIDQSSSSSHHHQQQPRSYLIITNISKRQNIKSLLQLAAAYGCTTVFVVGQKKFEFDPDAEGTDLPSIIQNAVRNGRMTIVKFDKLEECVDHIKSIPCYDEVASEGNCAAENTSANNTQIKKRSTIPIIGVEIDNSSKNLEEEPFTSSVAFMMGNEGSGMSAKQTAACDGFIRISQYGGGTCSLNVSVAAGLVLHRFFNWSRGDGVKQY